MKKIAIFFFVVVLLGCIYFAVFAQPVIDLHDLERARYYQEMKRQEERNDLIDNAFAAFFFSVAFFPIFILLLPFVSKVIKEKILTWFTKLVFAALIFLFFLVIFNLIFDATEEVDLPRNIALFLSALLFIFYYLVIVVSPASTAYDIVNRTGRDIKAEDYRQKTFWSLLDKIKARRKLIIIALFFCLVVAISADIFFFLGIEKKFSEFSQQLTIALFIFGLFLIFLYFVRAFWGYGRINIQESEHRKSDDVKKIIDNISIVAGIQPPKFRIVSHDKPNAFSICPNFDKPIIYITTSLLNLAERNELEAVLAHEIAHISSRRVFDYRTINDLLVVLRLFGFFIFLLFLSTLNPIFSGVWVLISLYGIIVFGVQMGMGASSIDLFIRLLNPPFLLIEFISYLIYYGLSIDEVIYADLEAVRLTRYPKPLYSILTKINLYKRFGLIEKLPDEYHYLYFTGEDVTPEQIPMSQPSVARRHQILEEIDSLLKGMSVRKEKIILKCPFCTSDTEEIEAKGHYGITVHIDRCPKCGSIWFDDWELWTIDDLSLYILEKVNIDTRGYPKKLSCPHCGIKLLRLFDPIIPKNIKIFYCSSCDGNWMKRKYLLLYDSYKKKISKEKSEIEAYNIKQ